MVHKREDNQGQGQDITFSPQPQSDFIFSASSCSNKRAYMALSHQNNLYVQSRQYGSAGETINSLPAAVTAPVTVAPLLSEDFVSIFYNQGVDMDARVLLQMERLQSGREQLRRKHCRDLMTVVEQQVTKRLRVKEVEMESLGHRNRELEEQVRQMSAENQFWFNYAKTSEAMVSSLRAKLDQVLTNQDAYPTIDVEQSYGGQGSCSASDAESLCEGGDCIRICRVCLEREVCVLLLPCRHLCLCQGCEATIDTCPVCNSTRNASIQVVVP